MCQHGQKRAPFHSPVGPNLKIENYGCQSVERGLSELNKLKVEKLIKSEHMWSPWGSCWAHSQSIWKESDSVDSSCMTGCTASWYFLHRVELPGCPTAPFPPPKPSDSPAPQRHLTAHCWCWKGHSSWLSEVCYVRGLRLVRESPP